MALSGAAGAKVHHLKPSSKGVVKKSAALIWTPESRTTIEGTNRKDPRFMETATTSVQASLGHRSSDGVADHHGSGFRGLPRFVPAMMGA